MAFARAGMEGRGREAGAEVNPENVQKGKEPHQPTGPCHCGSSHPDRQSSSTWIVRVMQEGGKNKEKEGKW
jgi:hypothetical protein